MRDPKLRRLFVRYRERGDLEALGAVFEATAPALFALARHLSKSREDAEDAVQACFLTAIERRASYDPTTPLESWLFGILLRKARRLGERAARRPDPARMHEPSSADPGGAAREAELSEALREAIAALPASYRGVLEAYLHDAQPPQEIARKAGVAAGTVRVRLHRGLRMLRSALPAGFAAGSGALIASAPELGPMRAAVLRAGKLAVVPNTQVVALATAGSAATRVIVTCGALIVAAGAWHFSALERDATVGTEEVAAASKDSDAPSAEQPAPANGPLAGPAVDARVAALASPAVDKGTGSGWTLELVVSGLDVPPPSPVRVLIAPSDAAQPERSRSFKENGSRSISIGAEWLTATGAPPALELRVEHPRYAAWTYVTTDADLRAPRELVVEVPLERRFSLLTGRIETPAFGHRHVAFYPFDRSTDDGVGRYLQPETFVPLAGNETFRLYLDSSSGWFVATAHQRAPTGGWLEWDGFQHIDVGTLELDESATIEGVAYVDGSSTAEPARVEAERLDVEGAPRATLMGTPLVFVEDRVVSLGRHARTGPSGSFRISGLTPGPYGVLMIPPYELSGSYDAADHGVWVEAPASGIELESTVHDYAFEVLSDGAPVPDATVEVRFAGGGGIAAPTDAAGRHALYLSEHMEPFTVLVSKPGFVGVDRSAAPADFGPERVLQFELERGAPAAELQLGFRVEADGPLGSADLELSLVGTDWSLRRTLASGATSMRIDELPAGTYTLRCKPRLEPTLPPEAQARWMEHEQRLECRAGSNDELTVHLPPAGHVAFHLKARAILGGSISGARTPRPPLYMKWSGTPPGLETILSLHQVAIGESVWLREALPPGEFTLEVIHENEEVEFPFTVVAGALTDVFVELD